MADFPRGGGGPPQPVPRGASVALVVISILTIAAVLGLLGWLLF